MSKDYSISINNNLDTGTAVIEFELLGPNADYWSYTATRYTGGDIDSVFYHVRDDMSNSPVGTVVPVFHPYEGIVWEYKDHLGMVEGSASRFKQALLKLTKSALGPELQD